MALMIRCPHAFVNILYVFPYPAFCGLPLGEALHQEQLQASRTQYIRWRRKILPDKESASCLRVPEFKCHMQRAGLDKPHDMLKDKPMKLSLRAGRGSMVQVYLPT